MKTVTIIIICFIYISCEKEPKQNNNIDRNVPQRFLNMSSPQALKRGIALYKEKRNKEAVVYLSHAIKNKSGKAYYYYGNVMMNLKHYKRAITAYKESYLKKYQLNNSIFNIACAYSLLKDHKNAMIALLENHLRGDRFPNRIRNDNDLLGFRNSKYYKKYYWVLNKGNVGFTPTTKEQILRYLLKKNWWATKPGEIKSSGIFFSKNGTFEWRFPGGNGGITPVGSWNIDNNRKVIIFNELGTVMDIRGRDEKVVNRYLKNGYYRNNKNLIWKVQYQPPRKTVVNFNDIRLKGLYYSASILLRSYFFYRLNIYGYNKKKQYMHGGYTEEIKTNN